MTARSRTRIGSDEARKWARKLQLNNPYAKSVIVAAANYVNEDGIAYPGIETLAQDTDISEETVIGRLRWCESIGVIALFKNWVDENGIRNRDGRGRVTSSEIRFLMDIDPDVIAANAAAKSAPRALRGAALRAHDAKVPDVQDEVVSPRPCGEQTENLAPATGGSKNEVSTRLAPDQPPPPATRTEEQKKEDSPPYPPQAGGSTTTIESEGWQKFKTEFEADNDPIVRVSIAEQLFAALMPDEVERVTRAAKGLIAWRLHQKKPPSKPSAQTFIREIGAWATWEKHAPPDPVTIEPPTFIGEDSEEWQALRVLFVIREDPEPRSISMQQGRGLMLPCAMRPATKALARFATAGQPIDISKWFIWKEGTQQCGAWCEFARVRLHNVFTGEIVPKELNGRILDWKVSIVGIRAPCEFPPRKDGTLPNAKREANLTEDDMKQL